MMEPSGVWMDPGLEVSHNASVSLCIFPFMLLGILAIAQKYTGEPIYFYMIGKNACHNKVLISKNGTDLQMIIPDYAIIRY